MNDTLYKKNSKGKILIWEINIQQSYNNVELVIKTGEYFGAKTLHHKSVKAKNIGKSNETTLLKQANLMLSSLVLSQRKYGYKSIDDLNIDVLDLAMGTEDEFIAILEEKLPAESMDIDGMLKPMLASQYFRTKKDWTDPYGVVWKDRKYFYLKNPFEKKEKGAVVAKFPLLGQAKINGVRCNVYLENGEVKMKSKEGEAYFVEHIITWFTARLHLFFTAEGKPIVYDGELYIHGEKLQYIRSAVVKPNLNTPSITYEVYDLAIPDITNINRFTMLKHLLLECIDSVTKEYLPNVPVKYIKTYVMSNDLHVQTKTDELIKAGYEGIILRNKDALYQFGKRNVNMLKLKRLIDEEFQIIGILPQDNDPELGLYLCITTNGVEFKVTPTEDEDYKRMMIMFPYLFVSKWLTCTFYEYTDKDIPFHIVHNIVRDYEDNTLNKVF
jgi:hypothetical protein